MNVHSLSVREDALVVADAPMAEALKTLPAQDEKLARARRRQIFLAACRVLERKSFHEATVKEIALEAGLAAGSIYVYLQSKDDILLLLADSMVAEFAETLPQIRSRAGGEPRRELLGMMRAVLDVVDRYREAFSVLNQEVRYLARRPAYRGALRRIVGGYTAAIEDVLARGRKLGVIIYDDLRSVVEAIHMLVSGWAVGADYLGNTGKEIYWRQIAALVEGRFFAAEAREGDQA
ncbi:MAG TPA: TetR/AcrR family transcriptional regulator [Candidatus Binataceae bacterium]|jgi:AcrR family transcriptional regulator|nr:TetR/AcrR family transcriptional regulator [Candidatus Binataceae bacterium]